MVMRFLVRIESVNMDTTVGDTGDLSVIRGGSTACLLLPEMVLRTALAPMGAIDLVFAGASQVEAIVSPAEGVTVADLEARIVAVLTGRTPLCSGKDDKGQLAATLPHMMLSHGIVAMTGDAEPYVSASVLAHTRLRTRQLQQPTVDLGSAMVQGKRPCQLDGHRPAPARSTISKGHDSTLTVSPSVKARYQLGREMRQRVYAHILRDTEGPLPKAFVSSLETIAGRGGEDGPDAIHRALVPAMKNKMAVVYLDGEAFGNARSSLIERTVKAGRKGEDVARRFADHVSSHRAALLRRLLDTVMDDPRMTTADGALKFETLMWGGDEACFVLPAWKLVEVLALLADDLADPRWALDGKQLTHRVGVAVCHYKMPIRDAQALARSLSDCIKSLRPEQEPTESAVLIQTVESLAPRTEALADYWSGLYGVPKEALKRLPIRGAAGMARFVAIGESLTAEAGGVPRSQIYGLLRRRAEVEKAGRTADAITDLVRRVLRDGDPAEVDATIAMLTAPELGGGGAADPWLALMRLCEVWDLFAPFGGADAATAEVA